MELRLADKVFLVAGSSRGIGRAIAEGLLEEQARVCITGRDAGALEATHAELSRRFRPERMISVSGDLSRPQAVAAVYEAISARWQRFDGLVANLGGGSGAVGWDLEEKEWARLFDQNFHASVRLAQAAIPRLTAKGGGIVFLASIAGLETSPAPLPYSAAKAALVHYSRNLARLVAAQRIRVNCIAPGNILFPGGTWERHLAQRPDAVAAMLATEVPMGRFGAVDDIAGLAAYLLSTQASFITGACFTVDGGQTRSS